MQRIVVLGAGESGLGAAMLAREKGYDVFVSDSGQISPARKEEMERLDIDFEEGKHSDEKILNADLIIKSPGISPKTALVTKASLSGIPIIAQMEFAFGYSSGTV